MENYNNIYTSYQSIIKKNSEKKIILNPILSISNYPNYHFIKHIKTKKEIRVLDLGAGTGRLTSLLAKEKNVLQLDAVENSFDQLKEIKKRSLNSNVIIHEIDIFEFLAKTNDSTYDLIYLIDVLEHFDINKSFKLVNEINRVLVQNGKFVCRVPNMISPFSSVFSFGDITHLSFYSPNSIAQLVISNSFNRIIIEPDPIVSSRFAFGIIRYLFAYIVSLIMRYSYLLIIGQKVGPYSANFILVSQKKS